jgi:hypothetical protein
MAFAVRFLKLRGWEYLLGKMLDHWLASKLGFTPSLEPF